MACRRTILMLVFAALLVAPSAARGDDIDDLKASVEQQRTAVNKGDLDAWLSFQHDQTVIFFANSPFAVEGKAALQQAMQFFFYCTRVRWMESYSRAPSL